MGDLILVTGKMTSLEIAKLTGKKHGHVIRDIDKMCKGLDVDVSIFGDTYTDEIGREQKMYSLDKRHSLILASGYNVKLRAGIIDRWEELERGKIQKPLSQLEIIVQSAHILQDHDDRIKKLEAHNNTSNFDFYSIAGYCSLKGLKHISLTEASMLGRKCTKLSEELEYSVKKLHDPRWGTVGAYHIDILSKIVK